MNTCATSRLDLKICDINKMRTKQQEKNPHETVKEVCLNNTAYSETF